MERELAAACARGEEGAWAELVRRYDGGVRHVLWRAGAREDLDDLRQEVWARLLGALSRFRGEHEGALRGFVGRVARAVAVDHVRRVRPCSSAGEEPAGQAHFPEALSCAALLDRAAAGSNHPARDRDILRLHFDEGCTAAEIAAMGLGLSVRGVESVLRRARDRLQRLLRDEVQP